MARRRLDEAVAESTGVTRSRARSLIMAGRVRVDGAAATKPGTPVRPEATLEVERARPYVSRGGEKLEGALAAFGIDPQGVRALDVGASTGGFTDCLLQHGAAHVVALDVGYGQFAYGLRSDPRVTVIERTNFRTVPPPVAGGDGPLDRPFGAIVIDASFISVLALIDRARAFLEPGGTLLALVKPQFEAGVERLGRGGVVRDPEVHAAILREFRDAVAGLGLVAARVVPSPLRGPSGNVEFFALVARAGVAFDDAAIARAVEDAPQ